ncbi:MAG: TIM barrel protein [Acidimicrobiales bacterium]
MARSTLPEDAEYVRTTPTFTDESVPSGLLRDHQVAAGNWAELRVLSGTLGFEFADEGAVRSLARSDTQIIDPSRLHRVVIEGPVAFELDFYRVNKARIGMLGINPDAFGVWHAKTPGITPWQDFLDGASQIGYEAVELGPAGYLPSDPGELAAALNARSLTLTCGYVAVAFHDPASRETMVEQLRQTAHTTAGAGAQFVLALARPELTQGRVAPDRAAIHQIAEGLTMLSRVALEDHGLRLVFHPHVGMAVETEEETLALLDATHGELALCFDVGQFAYTGGDPAAFIQTHGDRVAYVHLRDLDPVVRDACVAGEVDFENAARRDVFCEPGAGSVDFEGVANALISVGFDGPVIVERSYLDRTPDEARAAAERSFEVYSGLGFGKSG